MSTRRVSCDGGTRLVQAAGTSFRPCLASYLLPREVFARIALCFARPEPPAQPTVAVPRPAEREDGADAAFAAAIARAEFGRFYWNATLDGRLKVAMQPRPKDADKTGAGLKRNGKVRG